MVIALAPFALAIFSLVAQRQPLSATIGTISGCIALAFAALNFWLSFLRPVLWRRRHGSMDDYRFVSGLPGIGTFFAILACIVGFGGAAPAILALVALTLDTGGIPWFVFCTWGDQSMWDTEEQTNGEQDGAGQPPTRAESK